MFDKRITVFSGHYGSGKTEVAVNYALKLAEMGRKTAIVDLDIVNPFFRTADAKQALEEKGIRVILPIYANTNIDVPALPAETNLVFEDKSYWVVLDIGGEDLGAKVIARYQQDIEQDEYAHYCVINTKRPMTRTVEEIEKMLREIQGSAKIPYDGLVNNANLLGFSTPELLAEASVIIGEVSLSQSIPIAFISGFSDVLKRYEGDTGVPRLSMEKHIGPVY